MSGWWSRARFALVTGHAAPDVELDIDNAGWLVGDRVERHPSPRSQRLATPAGRPVGIMWHFTACKPGTKLWKRIEKLPGPKDRSASWHVLVEADGTLHQSVSFDRGSWHCRPATLVHYRGHGYAPNSSLIGVELAAGEEAASVYTWPAAQVTAATELVAALVGHYNMEREQLSYMHQDFDPKRRNDAGAPWRRILPGLVESAVAMAEHRAPVLVAMRE